NLLLEALYTGERYVSGDNANVLPQVDGSTLINLAVSRQLQNYHVGLRVNNLSNRKYDDFVTPFGVNPAPERNYRLEVGVEL
ncbi:MAG: TonB-dependent receptor, partial [Gammaproteobacteria bacterium]|nr:TonB-dependent receptor [Gammaproteobacteria bacterium]